MNTLLVLIYYHVKFENIMAERQLPEALRNWTESELIYFPRSPRVVVGAEADPMLESSIQQHFQTVKEQFNISKIELAKLARFEGMRLISRLETGTELTDSEINELIEAEDANLKLNSRPRSIRRAEDITGPMVSLSDLNHSEAPPSRSKFLPGLFIVYGGADSNKSHRLAKLHDFIQADKDRDYTAEYVIVGEPDHRSIGSWRETISVMRYGFINDGDVYLPDVLLIDSLKDLLYMPGDSGSGAGGLSTSTIMELSSISAQLMRDGRTVIAVVNPSQPKYMDDMFETLKSNVTGVFYYNPSRAVNKDKKENFVPKTVVSMVSSFRQWNNDYYDRQSDRQIMELVGLEGDILDMATTPAAIIATTRSMLSQSRIAIAKDVKSRMKRFLVGSTPANRT